jgi:hypothetical protein
MEIIWISKKGTLLNSMKETHLLHLYKNKTKQTTTSYTTIILINNNADHTMNSTATSPIYQERAEHQSTYNTEILIH